VSVAVLSAIENVAETQITDTIKTGTTLIEEGTLLPESLQFESEPWTSFYTAGGIIRELRKASGKQGKYGSEGNMAHSDEVIDHYNHPCDVGGLPEDDPNVGTGLVGEPECGDEAEFKTFGCSSAIASSSLTNEMGQGQDLEEALAILNTDIVREISLPSCKSARCNKILQNWGRLHLVSSPNF
jgi:nitrogen fixation NifU-like protein